jgi:hypothetical protein
MMITRHPKLLPTNSKAARRLRRLLRLLGFIALIFLLLLGIGQLLLAITR